MKTKQLAAVALAASLSSMAQATLFDRGGGLVYDDFLDVTWLADANYAKTSNYDGTLMDPYGAMTRTRATDWVTQLDYYDSVRNVTWSDWRLPTIMNQPLRAGCDSSAMAISNTKDCGFNVPTAVDTNSDGKADVVYSELAYMYYVNLGFTAINPGTGEGTGVPSTGGIHRDGTMGGEENGLGPNGVINHVKSYGYWSGTVAPTNIFGDQQSFYFDLSLGQQYFNANEVPMYAWAVRDGDVASASAVPEPSAMALFCLGMLSVAVMRRAR